ncbi:aldo/keto reductase [Amycolatopsis sp. 195334CR]|nr:aldo/keto reductase [Amycolatopsis sp. 195334CR]
MPGGSISFGSRTVSRLGLGTMRLTGSGTWGDPSDPDRARAVLRTAVSDLGITHLDTADAYGPHTVEELIRDTLQPYPADLLIATKVGMIRPGPNRWCPLGRPDYLRAAAEASLRRLGTDHLGLCYLHRVDAAIPLADQVGVLADLHTEGKIGEIGLSKVTPEQITEAAAITPIAAVQNPFNLDEPDDPAVDHCARNGVTYVPYRPLNTGKLAVDGVEHALRWLLNRGDHLALIPGTSNRAHLAELATATASFTNTKRE